MCPPVKCPSCREKTFHRGTCENEACGYDPLNDGGFPNGMVLALFEAEREFGLTLGVKEKPFLDIRVEHTCKNYVEGTMRGIGYDGPMFERGPDPEDFFETETVYGFDLVKDHAKPFLSYVAD